MSFVELPTGAQLDFETPEAFERALGAMRAGTPVIVRDEKSGQREIVWAPGDEG